jgi:hypothetical protein
LCRNANKMGTLAAMLLFQYVSMPMSRARSGHKRRELIELSPKLGAAL